MRDNHKFTGKLNDARDTIVGEEDGIPVEITTPEGKTFDDYTDGAAEHGVVYYDPDGEWTFEYTNSGEVEEGESSEEIIELDPEDGEVITDTDSPDGDGGDTGDDGSGVDTGGAGTGGGGSAGENEELNDARERYEDALDAYNDAFDNYEDALSSAEDIASEIESLQSDVESIADDIEDFNDDIADINDEFDENQSQRDVVSASSETMSISIDAIETSQSKLESLETDFYGSGYTPGGVGAGPSDQVIDPASNPLTDGEPVNLFSGSFYAKQTDISIGSIGPKLEITRYYNNQMYHEGVFGYKWDSILDAHIRELNDGSLYYWRGNGTGNFFLLDEDDQYIVPLGYFEKVTKIGFTIKVEDRYGRTDHFNGEWKLTSISDRFGNELTFDRNADGKKTEITDESGKTLAITYNGSGNVSKITDYTGREWKYDYDSGELIAVVHPPTSFNPIGRSVQYAYTTDSDIRMSHNLQTIKNHAGTTIVTNTYGAYGESFNRVITQVYTGNVFTFNYELLLEDLADEPDNRHEAYRSSRVINGRGITKEYDFNIWGKPLEQRIVTNGIRPGDPAEWKTIYTYDTFGNESEIEFHTGFRMSMEYDTESDDPLKLGNLISINRIASDGSEELKTIYTHGSFGQIKEITFPNGSKIEKVLNSDGLATKVTYPEVELPDGATQQAEETFVYNGRGQNTQFINAVDDTYEYDYHDIGTKKGLLKKVLLNGDITEEHEHDDLWRKTKVINADGHELNAAYNENDQLVSETGKAGANIETQYEYNEEGFLVTLKTRNVDENGTVGSPEWIEETMGYDNRGRLINIVRQLDISTTAEDQFVFDAENNMIKYTDPENRVVEFQYDERNLLYKEITDAGGAAESSESYYYDGLGNVTKIKDALNRDYTNIYDGLGRLERSTDPLGNYKEFTYDSDDNLKTESIRDSSSQLWHKLTNHWDIIKRIYQVDAHVIKDNIEIGLLSSTTYYDEKNRIVKTIDAGNNSVEFEYNAQDVLTYERAPESNEVAYTYTAAGFPESVKYSFRDANTSNTRVFIRKFEYDDAGRIKKDRDALDNGNDYQWNSRNLLAAVTSPNGVAQKNSFDLAGRIVKTSLPWNNGSGDSLGSIETERIYDKSGMLTSFVDAKGNASQYHYDARRNMIRLELSDGSSLYNNVYDEADKIIEQTDPNGNFFEYTYDRLGRLTRVDIAKATETDGISFERFAYNPLNQLIFIGNDEHTVTKVYDSLHRLREEVQNGQTFIYQFGGNGLLSEMEYPSGMKLSFAWDAFVRLDSIKLEKQGSSFAGDLSAGETIASFDYIGKLPNSVNLANGLSKHIQYDASGRPMVSTLQEADGSVLEQITGLRDGDGNLVYIHRDGIDVKSLQYDSQNQLEKVIQGQASSAPDTTAWQPSTDPSNPEANGDQTSLNAEIANNAETEGSALRLDIYRYDKSGNRKSFARTSSSENFSKIYIVNNTNQYTDIDGIEPEYDANGNMVFDGVNRYTYDGRNRMVSIARDGESEALFTFGYDNLNRLLTYNKEGDLITQQFAGHDMVENISDGKVSNRVMGLGKDQCVLDNISGNSYYRDLNEVRNTINITDRSGNVEAHVVMDEFGNFLKTLDSNKNEITLPDNGTHLFQGRPLHNGSETINFRARHYASALGRFLQMDGVGYASDDNLYRFALNNPLSYTDPSGNYIESFWDGFSLAIGVASFGYNIYNGNYGSAAIDAIGVVLDGVALALPIVPGGAGAAIKAYRLGDAALTVGSTAYKAERGVRLGQATMHGVGAARGLVTAQQQFSQGNYGWGAFSLVMSGVGARGMGSKWYNAPRPTPRTPISSPFATSPFQGRDGKLHFWSDGPWRAFGNNLSLIRNPRSPYGIRNIFSDDRTFRNVSKQYWRASGGANGGSLQHTFTLNSGNMPQWFKNAGFNLVEVPKRINSWMGDDRLRNAMFKGQVLTSMGIGGSAGGWTTKAVIDMLFGGDDNMDASVQPVGSGSTGC